MLGLEPLKDLCLIPPRGLEPFQKFAVGGGQKAFDLNLKLGPS